MLALRDDLRCSTAERAVQRQLCSRLPQPNLGAVIGSVTACNKIQTAAG